MESPTRIVVYIGPLISVFRCSALRHIDLHIGPYTCQRLFVFCSEMWTNRPMSLCIGVCLRHAGLHTDLLTGVCLRSVFRRTGIHIGLLLSAFVLCVEANRPTHRPTYRRLSVFGVETCWPVCKPTDRCSVLALCERFSSSVRGG